jgi:hypothetical protein
MRIAKFVVPALLGCAAVLGVTALAETAPAPAPMKSTGSVELIDFYAVNPNHAPGVLLTLCVVAPNNMEPRPAQILADDVCVAAFPLVPGANYVSVPDDHGTKVWTVTGQGIVSRSILDEGWGLH